MKRTFPGRPIGYYLLAGAMALVLPSLALAQGQIDVGRANDASNRVGSGGRNEGGLNSSYYNNSYIINNGNRIVTGNVSQGREFHGTVTYTDPSAFRGTAVGLQGENFTKNSTGIPHSVDTVPNRSQPFFGDTQTAAPPPGFEMNRIGTGYVPAPAATTRAPNDMRLGVIDLNAPLAPVPTPGEMLMRGSLNPQQAAQQAGYLTGSALYGVREWNPQDPADRAFLENILSRQNASAFNRVQLDPREVQRMRGEIEKALGQQQQQQPIDASTGGKANTPPDSLTLNPIGRTFDSPSNPAVQNKPVNDQVQAQPLSASGANTEQGMRYNLLGAARRTSAQYSELNKRLEQYNATHPKTDADYAREFNAEMKARNDAADAQARADAKRRQDQNTPNVTRPLTPDKQGTKPETNGKKPKPLKVKSLAQGVVGEGLSNVLKKAESLMREGKFASALDQYDAAEAVTPNNPLVWLGRANAELGAGFFKPAETHLQKALMTDNALMMGQYDLTAMIGEERLTQLVKDLKELANKNNTQSMPLFLLAYIAYNTGHEPQAMAYLDLAEKRGGANAGFYKSLQQHWSLPDTKTQDQGAKPEIKRPELNK
jgi:tetratricopeptide (TPR) repeat protein